MHREEGAVAKGLSMMEVDAFSLIPLDSLITLGYV